MIFIIFLLFNLIISIETNEKHVKRMIPYLYADFAYIQRGNGKGETALCNNCGKNICNTDILQKGNHNVEVISNIGQKAAGEAKDASEEQQASKAALIRKLKIVKQLQQVLRQAEVSVQEHTLSLQDARKNVQAANEAVHQAQKQLQNLTEAIKIYQANAGKLEKAANGSHQELVKKKTHLLELFKNHVELLLRQLSDAQMNFSNTKQVAAYKATIPAHQAKICPKCQLKQRFSNSQDLENVQQLLREHRQSSPWNHMHYN